jgi:hypothetical protein
MQAKTALQLAVEIPQQPVRLDRRCWVRVTLSNAGPERVLVNGRLAVGYRGNLARELYAELTDLATGGPALIYEVDYDRRFSPRSDYVWLSPGESLSTTFDLWEWYAPSEAGRYLLVMYYQADEQLADAPEETVRGVCAAAPIELDILGSTSGAAPRPSG